MNADVPEEQRHIQMALLKGGSYDPDPGDSIRLHKKDDTGRVSHKIKSVEVDLLRIENRNYKNNETKVRNSSSKKISSKKITLVKGQPKYLIQDCIQFKAFYMSLLNRID